MLKCIHSVCFTWTLLASNALAINTTDCTHEEMHMHSSLMFLSKSYCPDFPSLTLAVTRYDRTKTQITVWAKNTHTHTSHVMSVWMPGAKKGHNLTQTVAWHVENTCACAFVALFQCVIHRIFSVQIKACDKRALMTQMRCITCQECGLINSTRSFSAPDYAVATRVWFVCEVHVCLWAHWPPA